MSCQVITVDQVEALKSLDLLVKDKDTNRLAEISLDDYDLKQLISGEAELLRFTRNRFNPWWFEPEHAYRFIGHFIPVVNYDSNNTRQLVGYMKLLCQPYLQDVSSITLEDLRLEGYKSTTVSQYKKSLGWSFHYTSSVLRFNFFILSSSDDSLKDESKHLELEVDRLSQEVVRLKEIIRNAKDTTPIEKVSYKRVWRLTQEACMELIKVKSNKWLLRMGYLVREFKSLRQIWELFSQEDWVLSDIFNEPEPQPKFKKQKLCKFCSKVIEWSKSIWNRWVPLNIDGTKHRCLVNSG